MTSITLWIATETIGLYTQLAANRGLSTAGQWRLYGSGGGFPITWLLIQVFSPQNIPGFIHHRRNSSYRYFHDLA
ncbi:hypothetical protein ACLK18_11915 [Escherichia coli]